MMTIRKKDLPALAALLIAGGTLATAAFADRGMFGAQGGIFMNMPAFEEVDADGDGKLTAEEVDAYRSARATALDSDADGKVSLDELTAAEAARAAARAAQMMAARDAAGDGFLTPAELLLPPMPARMFEMLDADGDGAISKEEAEAARGRMMERMGDRMGSGMGEGMGEGMGGRMGRHHRPWWGMGDGQ